MRKKYISLKKRRKTTHKTDHVSELNSLKTCDKKGHRTIPNAYSLP